MQYWMTRLFYVLAPAVAFGLLAGLAHPLAGLIVGCAIAGFGLQMTQPRPERGEGRR